MGKWIMHDILVLKNLQDNIIGINCIKKHFLWYSAYRKSPVWETPPIHSEQPKTTEGVYLDALSSKKESNVKIKKVNHLVRTQQWWQQIFTPYASYRTPKSDKTKKGGVALAILQNCEPFGIWIEWDKEIIQLQTKWIIKTKLKRWTTNSLMQ